MKLRLLSPGLVVLLLIAGCGGSSAPPASGPESGGSGSAATGDAGSTDVDLGAPAAAPTEAPSTAGTTPSTPTDAAPAPTPAPTTPAPTTTPAATPPSTAAASVGGIDLSAISETGALAVVIRPSQALANPIVQGILKEMQAADSEFNLAEKMQEMQAQVGADLSEIEHVMVVLDRQHLDMLPFMLGMFLGGMGGGPPPGGFGPEDAAPAIPGTDNCLDDAVDPNFPAGDFPFGEPPPSPTVVFKFTKAVEPQTLLTAGGGPEPEEKSHAGQKYYVKPDGSATWFRDAMTAVMVPESKIAAVIDGQQQAGPLAAHVGPLTGRDIAVILDVQPLHEFISQMAQENPGMALAGGLVKQVNTLTLAIDLQGPNLLQVQLHTINEGSAAGLQGMLGTFLQQGQAHFAQQAAADADQLKDFEKELMPLIRGMVEGASLTAEGTVCSFTVPRPAGIEKLPELIRPALVEARQQASAARELNNLKQIGLAFHNYHDTNGRFPAHGGPGYPDAPGKGLSWRVHLLPYLEEFALYNEFNLDEPWDSEHNKALIPRMPAVFGANAEGKTSFHVFAGEGTAFVGEEGVSLAKITDGTSNTILVVEAGPDTADVWTKPGGLALDPNNPAAALGDIGEQFRAVFMDGAARRLPRDIPAETLRNLIQPNDGNPVQIP